MNRVKAVWQQVHVGYILLGVLWLTLGFLGAGLARDAGRHMDQAQRAKLLRTVVALAETLDPELIRQLHFDASDALNPADQILRAQLTAFARLAPVRGIYMYTERDGQLVFGPESYAADDPMASPSGTRYKRPPEAYWTALTSSEVKVLGPYRDEYGHFMSGLAPVREAGTGQVLAVVGVDVLAAEWRGAVRAAQRPYCWGTLAILTVLLVGVVWVVRRRRRTRVNAYRHAEIVLVLFLGLTVTFAAAWRSHQHEMQDLNSEFQVVARRDAGRLRAECEGIRAALESMALLFTASEEVSAEEYRAFAEPLGGRWAVRSYGWAPAVPVAERAAFEAAVRQADGRSTYRVWREEGADAVPVGDRLYPLRYVTSRIPITEALGFDLGSERVRREALQAALPQDLVVASQRVILMAEPSEPGLLLIRRSEPLPGRAPAQGGVVLAALPLANLVSVVLQRSARAAPELCVSLLNLDDQPPSELLSCAQGVRHDHQRDPMGALVPLFTFNRPLAIAIAPTPAYLAARPLRWGLYVLLGGLFSTGLLAALVAFFVNRTWTLERAVQGRTAEITRQRQFHEQLLSQADVWIAALDTDLRVLFWNHTAADISGLAAQEMLGRNDCWERLCPQEAPGDPLPAILREVLAAPETVRQIECEVRHPQGAAHWMDWTITAIREQDGRVGGLMIVGNDLTVRRQAEQERLAMERGIQEAQRLESLGVMAGGIAHDFNNLLMTIRGNAELAADDLGADAPQQEFLNEIQQATRQAADLCRQMLAYAGKGRFVIEPLNLNALLNDARELLHTCLPKQAVLDLRLADSLPHVEGDRTQIRQVVLSLVTNAGEALDNRAGVVTLATERVEVLAERAGVKDRPPPGRYVALEVVDTGGGMTAEVQARIFEPFFTTKFMGRGLGLPAVQGIVRAHGGWIEVKSAVGVGTQVRVLWPAMAGEPTPERPVEAPLPAAGPPAADQALILVVDDEAPVRLLSQRMLERLGYRVLTVASGREAREALDWAMPHMSGEETYHEIPRRKPGLPVLLASGYST
ncbi:MAG: CHASE domain-containing protein [Candidatus Marinimicrobia bacterium]|nr:CHASE domain-containing protein [Candidatus Neomarinimicrobiota bacterium]